jgi:TolB-like protein/DNA-binding winged helix-turn-helix (wHTH) protein
LSHDLQIGPWTVRPALNVLERGGETVRIEPRAMDVLVFLARHRGEVFSVDQLIAAVWNGAVVTDNSVYIAISQLRQALAGPEEASYIETIPKRGYRLTAPAIVEQAAPRGVRWRLAAAIAATFAVLAVIGVVVLRDETPASVAVLPFENLSDDPEQAYFADGITAELLTALSRVRDVRVAGPTSSSRFKARDADLRTVGEALDVRHVLQGSVRKSGEQVRIAAQLTNVRTGEQLWSETYARTLDDVFVIQDEIAKSVANALQVRLGVGDIGRVPGMTRNVLAYDEYLRGMSLNRKWQADSFPPAIAHLQRAVALDPSFSIAWAGLNTVYSNGALFVPPSAADWQRKGAEALEHARALTPDAPHVLLEIGIREVRRGDWLAAGDVYERLQASYERHGMAEQAWGPRGAFLLAVGRVREAIPALERARAHEPLAPAFASFLSQANQAAGDLGAAHAEVDRGLALDGFATSLRREGLFIALAQHDRAAIARRLGAIGDDDPGARLHRRLAELMDASAAAAEIRRLAATASLAEKVQLAQWAAYYREPKLAFELLAQGLPGIGHPAVLWSPLMKDVRRLPEFKALVRKHGYDAYWRRYGWSDFCYPAGAQDFTCE